QRNSRVIVAPFDALGAAEGRGGRGGVVVATAEARGVGRDAVKGGLAMGEPASSATATATAASAGPSTGAIATGVRGSAAEAGADGAALAWTSTDADAFEAAGVTS